MALNEDQISLLQAFIDDKPRGVYDAMDLIPEGHREYFSSPTVHGSEFAEAVGQNKFTSVEPRGMNRNSKHLRYALHGA